MKLVNGKVVLPEQLHSIELLRGIASVMVCYFHLSRGNKTYLPEDSVVRMAGAWGWTGVEIFFVISGFVIPFAMFKKNYSSDNFLIFLKKRIIRIEPPYIISIFLVILLNYISTLSPYYRGIPYELNWMNLLNHLAYLNVFTSEAWLNPVYWSLAIEFQYYLLLAGCFFLLISKKWTLRILFVILILSLSFFPLPRDRFVFNYGAYFMAGIILFQFMCNIVSIKEFITILSISLLTVVIHDGALLGVIVLATVSIILFVDRIPSIFSKLGLISYSLYLVHVPIGGRIINLSQVLIKETWQRELILFLAFFVSIVFAIIFYKLFEMPWKKLSSGIQYKQVFKTAPSTN